MTATPDTLHQYLRRATAEAHAQLDDAIVRAAFFVSVERYIDYLRRFHAFQSQAEQVLAHRGVESMVNDWPRRRRASLLLRDLLALKGPPPLEPLEFCDFQQLHRPAHVLGIAYVLEGSTLGAAVLSKQTLQLGITPQRGGSFLEGYGSARGSMWRTFLDMLAAWDARGIDREEVAEGALATFSAAQRHFGISCARPTVSV